MLTTSYLTHRFEELQTLLKEGDLSRISRRLLDFLADVELPEDLKRQAIILRAQYNAYAALEKEEQTPAQWNELKSAAQIVIEDIQKFLYPGGWDAGTTPQTPSIQLDDKNELPEERTVFQGKGIRKRFSSANFLFELPQLDVELKLGEITGVVGENGNGKTTLLRIVAGDLLADGGKISYPTLPVYPGDWYGIKQHIAFIPQHLNPWQGYLKENLHFTAAIHGIKGTENEARVDFIIHRLGLTQYKEAFWNEISSGFKLRFELARALVRKPRLLIIDEPLANLDINTQEIFLQDLRYLANSSRNPISILLSSQHLHEVESIADNIIFIKNGEALYNGSMEAFGQDREENLFELGTSMSRSDVEEKLGSPTDIRIEDTGRNLIIRTELDTDANELLARIVQAGVPVEYFRNISTSTLKLFREQP